MSPAWHVPPLYTSHHTKKVWPLQKTKSAKVKGIEEHKKRLPTG
ncbi:MAG: hypothetical protein BSOLF_1358 [Candidatus Carbobacillus altaicus]|uniref:Uncharacterized protein n=1 Tax=Candidatus Carbonibacillus altaicus TaxID=2163959 RepID=A0A2R6Y470_9BACL|nr:MAG: hypothetical protein BSOLF_1358 [Candidatus Carbobacillus altaicus]